MSQPIVSIIMPNYNAGPYLSQAIESILNQTYTDFEFIIIDDCSTDNSREVIQLYAQQDSRIIALRNEENLGVHKTRNKLINEAKGAYIIMMDSDDVSELHRVDRQVNFMNENSDIGLCGTNFTVIDEIGQTTGAKAFPQYNDEIRRSFFWRNPFGQNTVCVRRECFTEVGVYSEQFAVAEDLDMWIRIGTKYHMYNMQENLVQYRIHGSNSILSRQKEHIQNTLLIRKNALSLGYVMGLKGIIFYVGTWCMQFLPSRFVLWLFNLISK